MSNFRERGRDGCSSSAGISQQRGEATPQSSVTYVIIGGMLIIHLVSEAIDYKSNIIITQREWRKLMKPALLLNVITYNVVL